MRNLTIIDIDGVLNPFYARQSQLEGFQEFILPNNLHSVFLNLKLQVPYLKQMNEMSEIVWGSAWGANSNMLSEYLGLEQLQWIPISNTDVGLGTWKIKSIRKWVEEHDGEYDKVIWIDDELESDAFEWAKERGRMLAVAPDRVNGLTKNEFESIVNFLK